MIEVTENICLQCKANCCSKPVEVDKQEYEKLLSIGFPVNAFILKVDEFLEKNPKYEKQRAFFEQMYNSQYARLKRGTDGLCELLDRDTRLCSIYQIRPQACKDFTVDRCEKFRELKES